MATWTQWWKGIKGDFLGFVDDSTGDADVLRKKVLQDYMSTITFVHSSSERDDDLKKKNIYFSLDMDGDKVEFGGVPFAEIGLQILNCFYGPKNTEEKLVDHSYANGGKSHKTNKLECPAVIQIKEIFLFPQYKVDHMTEQNLKAASSKIELSVRNKDSSQINFTKAFIIRLPRQSDHIPHISSDVTSVLDSRVKQRVLDLVTENVTSTKKILFMIRRFVKEIFVDEPLPDSNDKRFYPSMKDITNLMNREVMRLDLIDCEKFEHKIEDWRQNGDDCYYRKEDYFFVYQSNKQKHLLRRYGNNTCLLDGTYKSTKNSLPLLFLCVETNAKQCVMAIFSVLKEDSASVHKALEVVKGWNPEWLPHSFMIDGLEVESWAVKQLFPDCFFYLCEFHCKWCWKKWSGARKNGVVNRKSEIIAHLNRIANSTSQEEFCTNRMELVNSKLYLENINFKNYVEEHWLREDLIPSWVLAFWPKDAIKIPSKNNCVEAIDYVLSKHYRVKQFSKSLMLNMTALVEEFIPEQWTKYVRENMLTYSVEDPSSPIKRPLWLVQHLGNERQKAQETGDRFIREDSQGFRVKSRNSDAEYHVNIVSRPFCECPKFRRTCLPCKHVMAVCERRRGGFNWDMFEESYKSHPFFVVDLECIKEIPKVVSDGIDTFGNQLGGNNIASLSPHQNSFKMQHNANFGESFRETMVQIINMSYLMEVDDTLHHEAERMAQQLLNFMVENIADEEAAILKNQGPPRKKARKNQ